MSNINYNINQYKWIGLADFAIGPSFFTLRLPLLVDNDDPALLRPSPFLDRETLRFYEEAAFIPQRRERERKRVG